MSKRIVIALGGNALGNTAAEQLQLVTETAKSIVDLIAAGNEVVVAHGNGPQVGMINLGLSTAAEAKAIKADMPFPECGAMSEGYIGYHLQQAIGNELASRGMDKPVATIVTQTVVSKDDPAFQNPTKPVGAFYDKETADRIAAEKGYTMVEDAGRGYRQVVPSPKPFDIVEKASIKALVDAGHVVIAVGGGGIPVIREGSKLSGTPAVIDKDFGSQGQQRTAILSMKMAATLAYEHKLGQKPLLLLDDVMSELDFDRQRAVMEIVTKKHIQTFITGTGLDFTFKNFGYDPVFHVENGRITEQQ